MLPGAVIRENLLFLRLVRLPQTRYLCSRRVFSRCAEMLAGFTRIPPCPLLHNSITNSFPPPSIRRAPAIHHKIGRARRRRARGAAGRRARAGVRRRRRGAPRDTTRRARGRRPRLRRLSTVASVQRTGAGGQVTSSNRASAGTATSRAGSRFWQRRARRRGAGPAATENATPSVVRPVDGRWRREISFPEAQDAPQRLLPAGAPVPATRLWAQRVLNERGANPTSPSSRTVSPPSPRRRHRGGAPPQRCGARRRSRTTGSATTTSPATSRRAPPRRAVERRPSHRRGRRRRGARVPVRILRPRRPPKGLGAGRDDAPVSAPRRQQRNYRRRSRRRGRRHAVARYLGGPRHVADRLTQGTMPGAA